MTRSKAKDGHQVNEIGLVTQETLQQDDELWDWYSDLQSCTWESLNKEINRLNSSCERLLYSAVESDYKEPSNYRQMIKRPEKEKQQWLEGMEK